MHRAASVLAFALVACEAGERPFTVDAAPDAHIAEHVVPFETTGTTPDGPLEVRFIDASYLGGFCGSTYALALWPTNRFTDGASVNIYIPIDDELAVPPTGSLSARAHLGRDTNVSAEGTFEIVDVDLPPADTQATMHIAGRVRVDSPSWQIDFMLDFEVEQNICF
jgi:hypothetical protein